jgi:hypothetical protein
MDLAEYLPAAVEALDAVPESSFAISLDNLRRSDDTHLVGPGQQISHCRVMKVRSQGSFQGWMDLGQQTPDPVGGGRDLRGKVIIEAADHAELGQRLIIQGDGPQRVRNAPGGFSYDRRIPGIGLRLARVQVRDPTHRQAGQITDRRSGSLGYRDGQRPDRGPPREGLSRARTRNQEFPAAVLRR